MLSRPVSAIGAELAGLQRAKGLAVDQRRGVDLAGGQRAGQVGRLDLDLLDVAAFKRGIESVLLDEREAHLGVAGRAQRIGAERLALELLRILDRRIALDPDAGAFARRRLLKRRRQHLQLEPARRRRRNRDHGRHDHVVLLGRGGLDQLRDRKPARFDLDRGRR